MVPLIATSDNEIFTTTFLRSTVQPDPVYLWSKKGHPHEGRKEAIQAIYPDWDKNLVRIWKGMEIATGKSTRTSTPGEGNLGTGGRNHRLPFLPLSRPFINSLTNFCSVVPACDAPCG